MLERYGVPLTTYEGLGTVFIEPYGFIKGKFKCIQLNNSDIIIELTEGKPFNFGSISLTDYYKIKNFEGV